jgi:imidazolonepropionase-like amidohydrolase
MWAGDPEKQIAPWRDTGVLVRGPAVADIERAFAEIWATMGEPIPESDLVARDAIPHEGTGALRVVASSPSTSGMFRVDQLVAALARHRSRLQRARAAGVTIVAGSDAYANLGRNRGELAKAVLFGFAEAGMPPSEVLQSVTIAGARLLRNTAIGVIRVGARADLIAVQGNPVEDLRAMRHVVFVMKQGKTYLHPTAMERPLDKQR